MIWRIGKKVSLFIIFVLVSTNSISIISHTRKEKPITRNPEIDDFMQESFEEFEKYQIENATSVRYYDESEVLDGYTIFITKKENKTRMYRALKAIRFINYPPFPYYLTKNITNE